MAGQALGAPVAASARRRARRGGLEVKEAGGFTGGAGGQRSSRGVGTAEHTALATMDGRRCGRRQRLRRPAWWSGGRRGEEAARGGSAPWWLGRIQVEATRNRARRPWEATTRRREGCRGNDGGPGTAAGDGGGKASRRRGWETRQGRRSWPPVAAWEKEGRGGGRREMGIEGSGRGSEGGDGAEGKRGGEIGSGNSGLGLQWGAAGPWAGLALGQMGCGEAALFSLSLIFS